MESYSSINQLAEEFLKYKRSNGRMYVTGEYYLEKYVDFSKRVSPDEIIPSKNVVNAFINEHKKKPGYLYNLVALLREFSRYLIGRGHQDAYIIPNRKVSLPTPVQPYLFTQAEIDAFFEACDNIQDDPHYKGRHLVLPAMYRLLYCCGLRCKEVRTLLCKNVHLDKNYIDIIQSKGPKSRRIFISEELSAYLNLYEEAIRIVFPERKTFFSNKDDKAYGAQMIEKNFYRFWYKAFPKKKNSGVSIRPYDFRHHFAYANMNRWLRERKDVNAMLPYLMKYMGHSDVKNTLYYFHLVPDIYDAIVKTSFPYENLIPEVNNNDKE